MDQPNPKIYIHGRRPGETIECDLDELEDYRKCIKSKYTSSFALSILTSTFIALTAPIASKVNVPLKRTAIGSLCFVMGEIFSNLYSVSACAPIMDKLIKSKLENSPESVHNIDDPKPETLVKEPIDAPPVTISDLDLSPPSSFSLDPGFKYDSFDYVKKDEVTPAEPKHLTYEELRMRNRGQYKQQYDQRPDSSTAPERGDEFGNTSDGWPRKTNIYGDVME